MPSCLAGPLTVHRSVAYSHLLPADVRRPRGGGETFDGAGFSERGGSRGSMSPRASTVQQATWRRFAVQDASGAGWVLPVVLDVRQMKLGSQGVDIELIIEQPPKDVRRRKKWQAAARRRSVLSALFQEQQFPEPFYYRNVDCVGVRQLMTPEECTGIIDFVEAKGFNRQWRPRLLDNFICDVVDEDFAGALWGLCGLGWLLRTVKVDGLVPCGVNEVIRVQKYVEGCFFGRHTDRPIHREDGLRTSKYSLRVFLNADFTGGLSAFHVPFQSDPVVFEPAAGMALLYPQGELCTLQEETEVSHGCKYMLRADVLFCRPEDLEHFAMPGFVMPHGL
ncbi:unnamed protein product [Polarella glacialis]|uniref:Prolyl 4-hydroxylase alpha subunit domain-containing protein n=1 Tax=Polarella glacialis TaxID=89957 RepID=A0A813ESN2_POLGL|nr:unnamed protein product [Polarella glacialis]